MRTTTIMSAKGRLSHCHLEEGEEIRQVSDFLDILASSEGGTLVLDRLSLDEAFFDLKTGLAGDCLQKVSNYRRRLVVLGDFRDIASRAFQAFLYESNRTGKVVFADSVERAVELLK